MIPYIVIAAISFIGLVFGMLLIFIAPEEQKPGRKYFILLENIFLVLIIVFLLTYFYYYKLFNLFYMVLWLFFIILLLFSIIDIINNFNKYFLKKRIKKSRFSDLEISIKDSYSIYAILAIIFYLSYKNRNLFFIESTLMFLYGITFGSLLAAARNKKQNIITILKHIHFLVIASLLFFI